MQINELANAGITAVSDDELTTDPLKIVQNLEKHRKAIYTARRIENDIAIKEKIQDKIQNRYDNFKTSTTKMIDSILQRYTDYVQFQNISIPNEIITELYLIQEHIQKYYKN